MTTEIEQKTAPHRYKVRESLGFLTGVAYRAINRRLLHNFKEAGHEITNEQFGILVQLWCTDRLTQMELSIRTGKDKPSVSRLLNHLEKKGYIERREDPEDKRNNRIHLTQKGKQLEEPSLELALKTLKEALKGVDEKELAITKKVLEKVENNLFSIDELCNKS